MKAKLNANTNKKRRVKRGVLAYGLHALMPKAIRARSGGEGETGFQRSPAPGQNLLPRFSVGWYSCH